MTYIGEISKVYECTRCLSMLMLAELTQDLRCPTCLTHVEPKGCDYCKAQASHIDINDDCGMAVVVTLCGEHQLGDGLGVA